MLKIIFIQNGDNLIIDIRDKADNAVLAAYAQNLTECLTCVSEIV
jgi:hypothetical protein